MALARHSAQTVSSSALVASDAACVSLYCSFGHASQANRFPYCIRLVIQGTIRDLYHSIYVRLCEFGVAQRAKCKHKVKEK